MIPDTVVFDLETQNFFSDPEVGWFNYEALRISALGVYSYARDEYFCFEESELPRAADLFRASRLLVGFSSNRYDIPVLNRYFQKLDPPLNLFHKERLDLLDEIELVTGRRVSLDRLALANLGEGKSGHGSDAARLFREGKLEELKSYCLKDVELTRRLYEQYRDRKFFLIPNRETGENERVEFLRNLFADASA